MNPRDVGIAFAALSMLTACSFALGDFSGYSEPEPNSSGSDGGGTDGGVATDAGEDASSIEASTEASTGFCAVNAGTAVYCEDFDGNNDALARFDRRQELGGSLSVDSTFSASVPKSLLVDLPQSADHGETYVVMSAQTSGSHARLDVKVRLELSGAANSAQVAKLWFFAPGGGSYEVGVGFKDSGFVYEYGTGTPYKEVASIVAPPVSGWRRFVIDVRIANGPRVDVDLDGTRIVDGAVLSPPYAAGAMEAAVGLPYVDENHGAWRVRFDDILYSVPK